MANGAFLWYEGDYLRDTSHLTDMEDLAYRRLLGAYYSRGGPLPNDPEKLCRVARLEPKHVLPVIEEFFSVQADGMLHQRGADRRIEERAAYVAEQTRKARLGAAARWENARGQESDARGHRSGIAGALPGGCPPSPPPSPPPVPPPTPRKKKPVSEVKPSDAAFGLSEFLLSELQLRYPNLKTPNMATWAKDCDRMIRIDKRSPQDAEDMIRWMAGDFWGTVVLCPAKLREKWDQIAAKMAGARIASGTCSEAQKHKYDFLEETA